MHKSLLRDDDDLDSEIESALAPGNHSTFFFGLEPREMLTREASQAYV